MNQFFLVLFLVICQGLLISANYRSSYSCPKLTLRNGKVRTRQRGRFVKFLCNIGFTIAGEKYSTCIHGAWDNPVPKCVRSSCNKVKSPLNGLIYASHGGGVLHFYCKSGYELHGPTNAYCDGRKWDSSLQACLPSNTSVPLSCDFEKVDICGWTGDLNHNFDWTRENFHTPSSTIGTGPSYDHTKGPGKDGYYMYIESTARNPNDTARLISPVYEKSVDNSCFEFFYHMYGATTGSLRVYVKKISQDWNFVPSLAFFSKSGNQGNVWYRAYHDLGSIDEDFQIIIEGIRGSSYVSDIAIDDVNLIRNCVFEEDSSTTTDLPSSPLDEVETCVGRCGSNSSVTGSISHLILCDCDDFCLDNGTCCPDYVDTCILVSTTFDDSTTDLSNNEVYTTNLAESTTDNLETTTEIITSSTAQRIAETTKTTPKKTPVFSPPTKRPIIILTAQTTPQIIEKILPNLGRQNNSVNAGSVESKTPKEEAPKDNKEIVDDGAVPMMTNVDEAWYVTVAMPKEEEHNSFEKEDYADEIDNEIHRPFVTHLGETHHLVVESKASGSDVLTIVIICCSFVVGFSLLALAVLTLRKYKSRLLRNLSSTNGDSQSDVRFLTSDEIIDLSLDREYDDL